MSDHPPVRGSWGPRPDRWAQCPALALLVLLLAGLIAVILGSGQPLAELERG